ncbi:MAG: acyl carrier protein [Gammaproteobacteria bacterium]|nr:acyl carrier protein [Gammaproteobacteria bacterium]
MKSREEIYKHVTQLMVNMFDLDINDLTEDANLYDDLDVDSIDAIDLIVALKSYTGKKVSPEDFKNVRTVGDIVTAVVELLADDR